jgi:uncharacterized protein YdaU (DUF1376 family)|tara:strand:+ start:147 stop:764 length:618 start_codon:yes stop_codon:yes gene_type:complete
MSVPYVKFYASDWRAGVSLLTDFQELLYFKICLYNWDTGLGVPEAIVSRLFRDECEGIADALKTLMRMHKVVCDDEGNLWNEKAISEHKEAKKRRDSAQNAASNRWKEKKKLKNAPASKNKLTAQCYPEPEPNKVRTDNFDGGGSGRVLLKSETYDEARSAAPGWDIYNLESKWREWSGDGIRTLHNPDRAFVGFCRKHVQGKRL